MGCTRVCILSALQNLDWTHVSQSKRRGIHTICVRRLGCEKLFRRFVSLAMLRNSANQGLEGFGVADLVPL